MTPPDQDAADERNVAGAGALLREAREARGLSAQQVAGALRLDVRYIEAMERDEYTQIVAPVFVRGYLRSYARFLKLSPDTIVTSYENQKGPVPKVLHGRSVFSGDVNGDDNRMHWIVYSLVLVSLILGIVWWQTLGPAKFWEDRSVDVLEPELSATPAVTNSAPAKTANDTVTPVPKALDADQTNSAAVSVPPSTPIAAGSAASPVAGVASTIAITPTQAPQPNPATPSVTVRVTEDSWVGITDAEGRHLIYKILPAGTTQTLQEFKLPLKVVLGKAAGVSLDYNGKPFDHSRYQRNGVARFELGSASTNAPNNQPVQ